MPLYQIGRDAELGRSRYKQWLHSLWLTAAIFLGAILLCTLGLYLLHSPGATFEARLLDSLWNAANTISTLGSLSTLNSGQKVFMIVAMLTLVGVGGYALTSLVGTLSREDIQIYLENRRMEKISAGLRGHVILAGFGPVGQLIAAKLKSAGETVVVVDRNSDVAREASDLGYLTILGSISRDGVLEHVNTQQAKALVVTIPDPDRKLAATLMARMLNPKLRIYAVADSDAPWLAHAGASEVVFGDELIAKEVVGRIEATLSEQR